MDERKYVINIELSEEEYTYVIFVETYWSGDDTTERHCVASGKSDSINGVFYPL